MLDCVPSNGACQPELTSQSTQTHQSYRCARKPQIMRDAHNPSSPSCSVARFLPDRSHMILPLSLAAVSQGEGTRPTDSTRPRRRGEAAFMAYYPMISANARTIPSAFHSPAAPSEECTVQSRKTLSCWRAVSTNTGKTRPSSRTFMIC